MMPGLDADMVLQRIRAGEVVRTSPVVMLTAAG
jgi:CheY-like chemotaxis protein